MSEKPSIDAVWRSIELQGPNPHATAIARDWATFGDTLGKDIGMKALTWNNRSLSKLVKELGGLGGMWRYKYPVAAKWLADNRYGHPAGHWRLSPWGWNTTVVGAPTITTAFPTIPPTTGGQQPAHGQAPPPIHPPEPPMADTQLSGQTPTGPPHVPHSAAAAAAAPTPPPVLAQASAGTCPPTVQPRARCASDSGGEDSYYSYSDEEDDARGRSRSPAPRRHRSASAPPQVSLQPRRVTDVWIVAGDIGSQTRDALMNASDHFGWQCSPFWLKQGMNTSSTFAQVQFCIDHRQTRFELTGQPTIHAMHIQESFTNRPNSHVAAVKSGLDIVAHSLMAFGTAGRGSSCPLRRDLKTFFAIGQHSVMDVNVDMLCERRRCRNTNGLSEASLLDEFIHGSLHYPNRSVNGVKFHDITTTSAQEEFVRAAIAEKSGTGANVLLMMLDQDAEEGMRH